MNITKEIINISNFQGECLGIKIILAMNRKTNEHFAIIADVSPASYFYADNVETGDILVSLNGIVLNSISNYNNVVRYVKEERNIDIQIYIVKKGALDGSDLIKRCIDQECSELCETWNEPDVITMKRKDVSERIENISITNDFPVIPFKVSLSSSVDELNSKSRTLSTSFVEEPIMPGKYIKKDKTLNLQKALPMNQSKKSKELQQSKKTTLTNSRDMIASPMPHFIKRPSARQYTKPPTLSNLKPTKSLSNVRDDSSDSQTSSNTESNSAASSPSPKFAPRKTSLPTSDIPHKPIPMPRTKHITHQKSLEPQEFFSLNTTFAPLDSPRSYPITSKPSPQHVANISKIEHLRSRNNQSKSTNKSTDSVATLHSVSSSQSSKHLHR